MDTLLMDTKNAFLEEVKQGRRFEFGKNWRNFLLSLTKERISIAEDSIKDMLNIEDLNGKTVLDIGSGSGLFSLAARNLGARIYSFDYDPSSVDCTKYLRSKYFPDDPNWTIQDGSVLDEKFLDSLGYFDVVYSWGVLHHTGNMWSAIENAARLVKKKGSLFIAIYNDQGFVSEFWRKVKMIYCSSLIGKIIISCFFIPLFFLKTLLFSVFSRKNIFASYKQRRGMSIMHDWLDWLGGYPFQVAKVEEILHFLQKEGFQLKNITTTNRSGNNQFVFEKE